MELQLFLKGLESCLKNRGIPPEVAAKHVSSLGRTFTEDDLAEIDSIQSPDEIDEIADSIAAILYKSGPAKSALVPSPQKTQTPPKTPEHLPEPEEDSERAASVRKAEKPSDVHRIPPSRPAPQMQPPQHSEDFFAYDDKKDVSPKGAAIFWGLLIVTLPITLALMLGVLAIFGSLFIGLIVCIIALVCAMIAIVAAGAGVSLIGIIYGITQLFSVMAFGLYEIGLGVIVAGTVLLVSILLYNIAIRFLPWVMQWLTVFFLFVCRQGRNLFYLARRECYKL